MDLLVIFFSVLDLLTYGSANFESFQALLNRSEQAMGQS